MDSAFFRRAACLGQIRAGSSGWRHDRRSAHSERWRLPSLTVAGPRRYNDAMPILTPRDEAAVRKEFERIAGPVKLVVFSQELAAPELCQQNEQLVREVA